MSFEFVGPDLSADSAGTNRMSKELKPLRVLVGCESSGKVRDAFIKLGHDAMSCDLLPTDSPGHHYQGDVFDVIDAPWDLAIFHPACTHLSVSGARHFEAKRQDGRQQAAVSFFMRLVRRSEHIPRRAFENPISIMSSMWRKPNQIIQPWQYGHGETKATCLWLEGLENLEPTNIVEGRESRIHKMPPSPDRWKKRSETFQGIADAIAMQWGGDCRG
tara:strand:- start:501 stop:1151 length:651 start_codon:yes stop_codon:yes gene_type:complete